MNAHDIGACEAVVKLPPAFKRAEIERISVSVLTVQGADRVCYSDSDEFT